MNEFVAYQLYLDKAISPPPKKKLRKKESHDWEWGLR